MTGRAIVWPDIHCNNTVYKPQELNLTRIPVYFKDGWLHPYGPYGQQKCFKVEYGQPKCLHNGRGITEVELQHLKHMVNNQHQPHQHKSQHQRPNGPHKSQHQRRLREQTGQSMKSSPADVQPTSADGSSHSGNSARVHSLWMRLQPHLRALTMLALEPGPANTLTWIPDPASTSSQQEFPSNRTFLRLDPWQVSVGALSVGAR